MLAILFGAFGLAVLVGYLDYVRFPLLAVFLLLIGVVSAELLTDHA